MEIFQRFRIFYIYAQLLAEIKSVIKDSYYYKGDFNKDSFYEILKEAVDDVEKGYKITLEETFDDFIKRRAK